jgi:uncharacterized protein
MWTPFVVVGTLVGYPAPATRNRAPSCDDEGVMTETTKRRPPTLAELRARRDEILEVAARHGVLNIRVFGSVARGDATDSSDVDLLIDVEDGTSLFDLGAFYMDLRELLGYEVDVGTEIKPRLRADVDAEAVPL